MSYQPTLPSSHYKRRSTNESTLLTQQSHRLSPPTYPHTPRSYLAPASQSFRFLSAYLQLFVQVPPYPLHAFAIIQQDQLCVLSHDSYESISAALLFVLSFQCVLL